jgi:ribosomal protein L40E
MARKIVGYVQTEWTCPNCNTRNPGPVKTCKNCGAPQPENVKFELPANQELVKDEEAIKHASLGPDIHCGYCGARNPADAKVCSQCGGDLSEGKRRQAGREMQAQAAPQQITCTNCGALNPASASNCSGCGAPLPGRAKPAASVANPSSVKLPGVKKSMPWWAIVLVLGLLVGCCIGAVVALTRPASSTEAVVSSVYWQTSVPVQEEREVRHSDESGSVPAGAYDVSCRTESREVCDEKTVDNGNGYAEVVQDCHDESQQYCSYSVKEWQTVDTATLSGTDLNPVYAQPNLSFGQRLGDSSQTYTVNFTAGNQQLDYSPGTLSEFQQFEIGSRWTIKMNMLGGIVSVER